MIKNYFKIALRNFWRHKVITLINISGLAIGISSALVIYLIVNFDFSFDKFHADSDRIYHVVTSSVYSGEPNYNSGVTGPLAGAIKTESTGVQVIAPYYDSGGFNVLIDNGQKNPAKFKDQGDIIYADNGYFNIFSYKWLAGSLKIALNAPCQVVLTAKQGKKYFPALSYSQMLGKVVTYNDSVKTTVTGIVQDFTQNSDFTAHDFISFSTMNTDKNLKGQLQQWGGTSSAMQLFVKLAPGVSPANAEKQFSGLLKKHGAIFKGVTQGFVLLPLIEYHFTSNYGGYANKHTLYGLMAIAVFLLLLGCINFINLTTAQASQRAKEIGIRKTMGSNRRQLVIQHLSETFLITLVAVIIAVALAPVILKQFVDFIPAGIKAGLLFQPTIIVFLIVLTIVVSLLSGFYPAIVLSGYKPVLALKNQTNSHSSQTRNAWLRKSLTVSQFIIAQFFIMATMLVSKQVYFALHADLGFKKDAILTIETPWGDKNPDRKQVFINKIHAIPQVAMVSLGGDVPSSNGWNTQEATYKDGKKEITTDLQTKSGDENYIKIYHIKLLAGRDIRVSDSTSAILINSTYAHILGFKNAEQALSKFIGFGDKQQKQIVGIIGDFYQGSLHSPIKPLAIYPDAQYNFRILHIALKPETAGGNDWKKATGSMQLAWKQIYPDHDFEYNFFDESIAKYYKSEQHTATLLSWATGLSIFISCLGLLGLAVYTTNQRTKEIGVRKVLGATVSQIVTLLSTELVLLVLLAFVIVSPVAWWAMNKWMQDFTARTAISWWIFALSGGGMLLTALITLSFQTVRAAVANPVKSLRSE